MIYGAKIAVMVLSASLGMVFLGLLYVLAFRWLSVYFPGWAVWLMLLIVIMTLSAFVLGWSVDREMKRKAGSLPSNV